MSILVYIEARDHKIRRISHETLGAARRLSAELGNAPVVGVLPGHQVEDAASLGPAGCDRLLVCDAAHLGAYTPDGYAAAVAAAAQSVKPEVVLVGASALGQDLAPRVAALR